MKILFITPCYYPAIAFGGTVSALSQMCEAIAAQGEDVSVFTTDSNGTQGKLDVTRSEPQDVNGVNVHYFHCNILNSKAYYSSDLIKTLKRKVKNYDVVYISAIWQMIGPQSAKVCLRNNIPYIVGTHGSFSKILRKKKVWIKNVYYKTFLAPMIKNSQGIHITCNKEKEDADHWLTHDNYYVIPNVLDPKSFSPGKGKSRSTLNIPDNAKVIITAARPDWMKRIDILIACIAELENTYLIYAGEDKATIVDGWKAKAKELNVSDKFITTGLVHKEQLTDLYNSSDAFCLISENENFGMVVAEAMLCNKPIVVSEMAGIAEYLSNQKDIKIVENDIAIVTQGIKEILSIQKSETRNWAIKQFSPDTVGNKLQDMFKKASLA